MNQKTHSEETAGNEATSPSRRNFIRLAGSGLGVAAAGVPVGTLAATPRAETTDIPSIRLADAFKDSLAEAPAETSFSGAGMTGAEVFADLCKKENLAALFCCPGNYTIINAIAASGIPTYGGRAEGSMCAMADGFSRATGEVVVTFGTEGPGFTHMIMNIAAANAARTPLLVLASNMTLAGEDREAFIQHAYQQPTTEGMKKYGKRLIDPARVHEYGATAFRISNPGCRSPCIWTFWPRWRARASRIRPSLWIITTSPNTGPSRVPGRRPRISTRLWPCWTRPSGR